MMFRLNRVLATLERWRIGPSIVVLLVALWLTRSFWLPGRFLVGFDTFAYSGPNSVVTAEAVQHWRLPIINQYIFGGVTHLGNPQAGVMYLPRLLTAVMDVNRAMGLLVVAHVVFLGLGMRRLLRVFGCSETAALFGAVVLMGSGAVMTKAVQFEQVIVVAWLPWLLCALRSVVTSSPHSLSRMKGIGRRIAVLAVVVAAVCSAGHPQLTYQLALVAGFVTVVLIGQEYRLVRSGRLAVTRLASVGAGVTLGVMMVLPQIWAALVATSESAFRSGRSLDDLGTAELTLPLRSAARAILGTVRSERADMFVGSFESISYVGVVVVVLGIIGVFSMCRRKHDRAWILGLVITGALSFVFSLGPKTFIFRTAFKVLPGFDLARVSSRWLIIVTFVLCVLSAVGLDAVRVRLERRVLLLAAGSISIGFLGVLLFSRLPDRTTVGIWIATAVVVVGTVAFVPMALRTGLIALVVILGAGEVLLNARQSPPQIERSTTAFTAVRSDLTDWLALNEGYTVALSKDFGPIDEVIVGLRPNANVLVGVRSIDGYDGGVQITSRWADALLRFSATPNSDLPLRNNLSVPLDADLAARTGIRYLLVERSRFDSPPVIGWGSPVRSDELFDVYENPSWLGEARVWFAGRTVPSTGIQDSLRNSATELRDVALTSEELQIVPELCSPMCSSRALLAERVQPERIRVTADLEMPGLVTFPVQYGPGWRVTVDGEDARLVSLDHLFLGVEVPPGQHAIEFSYRPGWLTPTVVLALSSWLAVAFLAVRRQPVFLRNRPTID